MGELGRDGHESKKTHRNVFKKLTDYGYKCSFSEEKVVKCCNKDKNSF